MTPRPHQCETCNSSTTISVLFIHRILTFRFEGGGGESHAIDKHVSYLTIAQLTCIRRVCP